MQYFGFSAQLRGAYLAPLQHCITAFSDCIENALKENSDEILMMAVLFHSAIRMRYLRYHWLDKLACWFYPRPFCRRCTPRVGGAHDGGFSNCIFNIYAPLIRRAIMIASRLRPVWSACADASAIASLQNKCKRSPITATDNSRDRLAAKAPFTIWKIFFFYLKVFWQDILSAQPKVLYRAWMAEFLTAFFHSFLIN